MKAVILAGGLGSRLSEETSTKPKPMVEIGGYPILWHILKIYSSFGINDFIICLGYKGYIIKEYFANYFLHMADVTYDLKQNTMEVHQKFAEDWKITLVNTGDTSMTGGRLKRIKPYLGDDDFCFTYGDGVGNIDINAAIELHKNKGTLATVTAVLPDGRFGVIEHENNYVKGFYEKPKGDGNWVNGGFFVLSPRVLEYIADDNTTWEQEPMQYLASDNQMSVYFHEGFWHPMDTLRDKNYLESLWQTGTAPWKTWA
ncbi:MAG: glucose-1-phosphate cytidylyltransferase [Legionella sp.]|nr:glucose-1-phosphate cytidylyltransferase [Legionella sp.]